MSVYHLPAGFQFKLLTSGNPVFVEAIEKKWEYEEKHFMLKDKILPLTHLREFTEDQISRLNELCQEINQVDQELATLYNNIMAYEFMNLKLFRDIKSL